MSVTVGRQTASYRQGLVLGLTMAEIMLLLVFCLLIAAGVALAAERAKRDDMTRRLRTAEASAAANAAVVDTIRRNGRLAELLDQAARPAAGGKVDEFWRKLVESNEIVDAMERRGISRAELREESASFASARQLRRKGIDPDTAARGAALAAALDAALPGNARRSPEEIASLVAKGLAASQPRGDGDRTDGHNWPPIITLSEADGYYFASRSAELRPDFAAKLRTAVVERLLDIARAFPVDIIEVIGHTDERPVSGGQSNLDRELPAAMAGASGVGLLQPADNAGLGLARALAVVKVLTADPRLRSFRILPLSAAQLIGTDGRLTRWDEQGDVQELRRIEIRMRRSS
jgi:outer membrane protein OmpA-like peptidoglycan-associated protein